MLLKGEWIQARDGVRARLPLNRTFISLMPHLHGNRWSLLFCLFWLIVISFSPLPSFLFLFALKGTTPPPRPSTPKSHYCNLSLQSRWRGLSVLLPLHPSISSFSLIWLSLSEPISPSFQHFHFVPNNTHLACHYSPVSQNPSAHPFGSIRLDEHTQLFPFGCFCSSFFSTFLFSIPRLSQLQVKLQLIYSRTSLCSNSSRLNMWLMCIPGSLWVLYQSHYRLLLSSFLLIPNGLINLVDYIGSAIIIHLPVSVRCKIGFDNF